MLLVARITSRKKEDNSYLDKEDTFHIGILSSAFKKKKEGPSLSQQQCTNHHVQPVRNLHSLTLVLLQ